MATSREEEMKISFRVMKTIPLEVKKSETIQQVRNAFSEIEGVSKANLKNLFFAGNCLEKDRKLEDYNIQNGSIIDMFLNSGVRTEINVKMPQLGKTTKLDVDIRDTVHTVKGKIRNKEGRSGIHLNLIYFGEELDDIRFLSAYNIRRGSTLYALFQLTDAMQVNVSLEKGNRSLYLKVRRWYTVENVKNIIESMEGVPAEKQRLCLDEVNLANDKTLEELNISDEETLNLSSTFSVTVRHQCGGPTMLFQVSKSTSIGKVYKIIQEREGVPIKGLNLLFDGRRLEPNSTFGEYDIEDGATIDLMLCVGGCL